MPFSNLAADKLHDTHWVARLGHCSRSQLMAPQRRGGAAAAGPALSANLRARDSIGFSSGNLPHGRRRYRDSREKAAVNAVKQQHDVKKKTSQLKIRIAPTVLSAE
jgi:hypothetical protein